MVRHDHKTVIMHFARKHDNIHLWNYVTGLRGNDDSTKNGTWKEIVTTVIRGDVTEAFAFDSMWANGWLLQYRCNHADVERVLDRLFRDTEIHAQQHAQMALSALAIYYEVRHGKDYKEFAKELRNFRDAIAMRDSKKALAAFDKLHYLWG